MAHKVIDYFLSVLGYNPYKQFPDESDWETNNYFFEVFENDVKRGKLNERFGYNKIAKEFEIKNSEAVAVAIIPKWFETILVNPKEKSEDTHKSYIPIAPFYISTKVNADNLLDLDNVSIEWATCLDEPSKVDGVSFTKHDVNTESNKKSWETFIESVKQIYNERYNTNWKEENITDSKGKSHPIKVSHYAGSPRYWIMREDAVTGTKRHIANMLNYIKDSNAETSKLFEVVTGETSVTPSNVKEYVVGEIISTHLGQMKNEYPLADSQRQAIHCMGNLNEGNVLAVSGPPGTGKTTMLQSVVADMIVKAVLKCEKDFSPPTILATSANNKAITNIIDAFEIEGADGVAEPMFTRWITFNQKPLPLAVYLPSGQAKGKEKFFCSNERGELDYQALRESWKQHKAEFLRFAKKEGFSNANGVSGVKEQLRKKLFKTYKLIEIAQDAATSTDNSIVGLWNKIRWFVNTLSFSVPTYLNKTIRKSTFFDQQDADEAAKSEKRISDFFESQDAQSLKEYTDKALDMSLRFKCFWLAVHYFEACWLEKIERNPRGKLRNKSRIEIYKEMSLVCPCIVATFFRAPHCFTKNEKAENEKGYLFNFVDLLIVDEAGQACTEIGLPTFTLAKKAIVVGDEDQIPPIYSIRPATSRAYWEKAVDNHSEESFELVDSSCSSVMKTACGKSAFNRIWDENETIKGLFLNEHRRCYNDIVAYCNKLIYKGKLTPLAGDPKPGKSVLPVMAHYCVAHKDSTKPATGSRKSEDEAIAIIEWIKTNESVILKEYKGKKELRLEDIISIITPFTLQAKEIKDKLEAAGYNIPCGTVHTFQGAESPIVIYSTVYGSEEESFSFINSSKELMNVAVSRAKHHFFVFCSKGTDRLSPEEVKNLDAQNETPLSLLLKMTSEVLKPDYSQINTE